MNTTQQTAKHTPVKAVHDDLVLTDGNEVFCICYGSKEQSRERATLIVRACNSHDELIRGCQEAGGIAETARLLLAGSLPETPYEMDGLLREVRGHLMAIEAMTKAILTSAQEGK